MGLLTENIGTRRYVARRAHPDEMVMDVETYQDLEIFEGLGGATSIYDLCNVTRTVGGANALRARMKKPWSRPDKIRAVQESLVFILAHRAPFDRLPSDSTTQAVDKYLHGSLPLVPSRNAVEYWAGALELRFGDFRPYSLIVRGVHGTSEMIRALRRLSSATELSEATGEVGGPLQEVCELVARPAFQAVGGREAWGLRWWKVVELDRLFRRTERDAVERLLRLVFELDALVSMADVVERRGFVLPEIVEGPLFVSADGLAHPLIEKAVANPLHVDQERRMLFLTGPNMAGKTTYLRTCAIALYLAHLGMGVPARSFRFSPCQRLFSSITVHDDVRSGVSFFRAEALRVKSIAEAVAEGYRVIAFMDEPFKGTNVKDAFDVSRSILELLAVREDSLFLVSSHLLELGEQMSTSDQLDYRHFEAVEHEGRLRFEYRLRPGISTQRLGMRVIREEGIFTLLQGAT